MRRIDRRQAVFAAALATSVVPLVLAGAVSLQGGKEQVLLAGAMRAAVQAEHLVSALKQQKTVMEDPVQRPYVLPAGADVAGTMQLLQELADSVAVELDSCKSLPAGRRLKQVFQLAGRGSPASFVEFLRRIEQSDRILVVESSRIVPDTEVRVAFELQLALHIRGAGQ